MVVFMENVDMVKIKPQKNLDQMILPSEWDGISGSKI
jgi:hypothetical protein